MDTFVQIVLSVAFLIPGYIVFKAKQSVALVKTPSKFELTIQSVIYSVVIFLIFVLLPFCRETLFDVQLDGDIAKFIKIRKPLSPVWALVFLSIITALVAVLVMIIRYKRLYKKILRKLHLTLFDAYETPWEQFVYLATTDQWLEVELTDGKTYQGILLSLAVPPYETELILQYGVYREKGEERQLPIQVFDKDGNRVMEDSFIKYAIINIKDIRVARVVRGQQAPQGGAAKQVPTQT